MFCHTLFETHNEIPMTETYTTPYLLSLIFERPSFSEMKHIKEAKDINILIREIIDTGTINHKEYFWIVLLTRSNRVLGIREISSGKTDATCVSIKEIAQCALLSNCCAVCLIHNHPSGNLKVSDSDIKITKKVINALNLFEILVVDHLIITQEGYSSFVDEGLIIHDKS